MFPVHLQLSERLHFCRTWRVKDQKAIPTLTRTLKAREAIKADRLQSTSAVYGNMEEDGPQAEGHLADVMNNMSIMDYFDECQE